MFIKFITSPSSIIKTCNQLFFNTDGALIKTEHCSSSVKYWVHAAFVSNHSISRVSFMIISYNFSPLDFTTSPYNIHRPRKPIIMKSLSYFTLRKIRLLSQKIKTTLCFENPIKSDASIFSLDYIPMENRKQKTPRSKSHVVYNVHAL